ncbi:MAG: tRNA isopentenyltransferase (miaA) [Parcubacteria group bacterium Gr01-1014_8]|nr:MAG: tRNA isopentenyltransferase (miaA) [Parcubacteria group bacterium Gr01-1014_8]
MSQPKVFAIVGPTSSGKSAFAVELARKIDGEVISADSRQVYTGLDIGSGKITKREMKGIRHHLLDVSSPKKVFTASDLQKKGRDAINDILARGKVPIVCGGTGFYIDALLGRISLPNVPADPALRSKLAKKSASQLYAMLKIMDPKRALSIDKHNPVRLVRAIEIAKKLGKVPAARIKPLPYDIEWIGLNPGNTVLRAKIHKRLLARMKQGMITEVKRLHSQGVSWKRMHELGLEYRHLSQYLQGDVTKKQMAEELERDIWHYAKRQMTYWRRNTAIRWISVAKDY